MNEPVSPQKAPYGLDLEPGKYWWCACGRSVKQPFCDGSHKGSEFEPVGFELTENKKVWLCGCKQTRNPPFCDGTHSKI